ncbi:MAG: hypothetical protein ABIA93_05325 [Candidatus Woesearchaeota archaeon]
MNKKGNLVGKSTNLFLIVLIVIMAMTISGVTVFFQQDRTRLTTDLHNTTDNLNSCQDLASAYRNRLDQAVQNLNSTEEDIRVYDQLYSQKAESLGQAQQQLEEALTSLKAEQVAREKFKQLYLKAQADADSLTKQLSDLNTQLTVQKAKNSALAEKVDCLESTDDADEDTC